MSRRALCAGCILLLFVLVSPSSCAFTPYALFVSIPLQGHLTPLVAQAIELAKRGWKIEIASTEKARYFTESAILPYNFLNISFVSTGKCEYDGWIPDIFMRAAREIDGLKSAIIISNYTDNSWLCMYDFLLGHIGKQKPSVVVSDLITVVGADIAEKGNSQLVVNAPFPADILSFCVLPNADYSPPVLLGILPSEWQTTNSLKGRLLYPLARIFLRIYFHLYLQHANNEIRKTHATLPSANLLNIYIGKPIIVNSAFGFDYPRPLPPLIRMVGPLTLPTHQNLSKSEQDWLDGDNHDGMKVPVVYVAMGTLWVAEEWQVRAFVGAFLPGLQNFRVLWRIDKNTQSMIERLGLEIPPHVHTSNWVSSQYSILAHEGVKVFVTHCGHNSVYESMMTNTIPICVPLFFEQVDSAARVEYAGVGLRVANKNSYTAEELSRLIQKALFNIDYHHSNIAKIHSAINLAGGVEEAANWIEHVAKYGTSHLVTPDTFYPEFAQYNLDVFSVYLGFVLILLFFTRKCLRKTRKHKRD